MSSPRFLVAVNNKEHSIKTLELACQRAQKIGAEVELIYVIEPIDYNVFYSISDKMKDDLIAQADEFLSTLSQEMNAKFNIPISYIVRDGNIAKAIIKHINKNPDIILLMIGVASDGSTSKTNFLNQIAGKIGTEYAIPLMVVPGNTTIPDIL